MKIKLNSILILLFISFTSFSQGTNNDFEYDKQDFNLITKELGFYTFKFPVKQAKDQLFDIVVEEFENGKLLKTISIIDDTKDEFKNIGLDPTDYFKPKNTDDSVFTHRIYFHQIDTLMRAKIKIHGIESKQDFSFKTKSTFDLRALYSTKTEIDSFGYISVKGSETVPLMFLYANSADNKDGALFCPAGAPKDKLIQHFYYVIYISVKEYEHN